ncbi:histidine kinase [Lancefieldella rimae]|uniref:sensor histidine kinase n=2 Tax=Atopobiaceae TaxID=1643824 RepID=UPI0028805D51|nr:histidine kinase [Lancefieldella rimae]
MGERLDALSKRWEESQALQLVTPVVCIAWETMLLSRMLFLEATPEELGGWQIWLALLLNVLGCMALFVRRSHPLPIVAVEAAVLAGTAALGYGIYVYLPFYIAVYTCVARASRREAAIGTAVALVSQSVGYVLSSPYRPEGPSSAMFFGLFASTVSVLLFIGAGGMVSRMLHDRRLARAAEVQAEQRRTEELAQIVASREKALKKGRLAAELHDSVGHDLTAIVALSEGLMGTSGNSDLDEGIATINRLAREGLDDTRKAVRALSQDDGGSQADGTDRPLEDGALPQGVKEGHLHGWDEVKGILGNTRLLGTVCTFTETGRRPQDPLQADLAFSVTREALTNAVRHGRGEKGDAVERVVVSWDHADDGSVTVTVRDSGRQEDASSESSEEGTRGQGSSGTGLLRLGHDVRLAGGTFEAGFLDGDGWTVRAAIPATAPTSDATTEREGAQ